MRALQESEADTIVRSVDDTKDTAVWLPGYRKAPCNYCHRSSLRKGFCVESCTDQYDEFQGTHILVKETSCCFRVTGQQQLLRSTAPIKTSSHESLLPKAYRGKNIQKRWHCCQSKERASQRPAEDLN